MADSTSQLVLRGDLGEGSDQILLSFPDAAATKNKRKVVIDSTIQLGGDGDSFVVAKDNSADLIIIDDGSVLADFETYTLSGSDVAGVTFIGVPPPPAGGVPVV